MSKEILEAPTPNLAERREKRSSFGVALVIVGIDPRRNGENETQPKIWTIIEQKSKDGTERVKGQISFPAETKKNREEWLSNMLGALSEFVDASGKMMDNLFLIQGSSFMEEKINVRGNPADIAVLIYEGDLNKPINPVDDGEITPNGWMTIEELRRKPSENIRSSSLDILNMEEQEGFIGKIVAEYFHNPIKRIPLRSMLPKGFSIKEFLTQREKSPDFLVVPKS